MTLCRTHLKRLALGLLALCAVGALSVLAVILYARFEVLGAADGRIAQSPDELERAPVALVLGTSPKTPDGQPNLFFEHRMDAAYELYQAGKVERFLVSGANPNHNYDESSAMKLALIQRGVPAEMIARDFAAFRTLDSVVRAQEIFGCDEVLIVSQEFHVQRALYLADEHGLKANGYAARDVSFTTGFRTMVREELARVKAVLDVKVLDTEPKFLGPEIKLATAD